MAKHAHDDPYRPDDLPPDEAPAPTDGSGRGCLISPNAVTVLFLLLTALMLVYVGILLVNPYVPINPFPPRTPLPIYVVATLDPNPPTATPTETKIPDTPALSTLAPTLTPTPSPTTLPPTETAALVEPPPTTTPTASRTPTATLIGGGTAPAAVEGVFTPPPPGDPAQYTRSPFPFTVYGDAAVYIANPNGQGCNWASIAGSVTALAGGPLPGLAVHISGEGLDEIHFTGTALTYGQGGYEIFLNGTPIRGEYVVQLLSQTGAPISAEFPVTTSPLCEENVAIVNFVQNHEY